MIQVENIGFTIQGKTLLKDISLEFKPNEIAMIIGPNGAGKSTLIKLLSQEHPCTSGSIIWDGVDLKKQSKADLAKNRAILSQNVELAFPLTVREVVMMGRYPHFESKATPNDQAIVNEAMQFFDIEDMADRNYLTLSGGEKQRVHFARVSAQIWPEENAATRYLLLDEPLTYLDIHYQYEFIKLLQRMMTMQPLVIVGVVHDLNLAYRYAHQAVLIHDGKLLASGAADAVFTSENIQKAFRIEPHILFDEAGRKYFSF